MGQLLSSLNLRSSDALVPDIGLDIENAQPSVDELQLYNQLSATLVRPTAELLHSLKHYQSASQLIRDAIASPSQENETKAWNGVVPIVDMLQTFYDYAVEMEANIPQLLDVLCHGNVNKNLEKYQGLTRLFADILDFVFEFDHLKMRSPTLQNDFSYYRRLLQRGQCDSTRKSALVDQEGMSDLRSAMLKVDQANRMSLFIAYPTPMLKCVIEVTTEYVAKNRLQKSVGECLAALWATCFHTANKKRGQQPDISTFCLKVMVVAIILYDHIDPNGAFSKTSPINIKHSVKIIQAVPEVTKDSSASYLISTLRYNSKHLNDDTTPRGVKNIVMAAS